MEKLFFLLLSIVRTKGFLFNQLPDMYSLLRICSFDIKVICSSRLRVFKGACNIGIR